MTKHSTMYQEKLNRRRSLITKCEEYKKRLEASTDEMERRIIWCDADSLISRHIMRSRLGGTSSFRHYTRYFASKEQEVFTQCHT